MFVFITKVHIFIMLKCNIKLRDSIVLIEGIQDNLEQSNCHKGNFFFFFLTPAMLWTVLVFLKSDQ